MSESNSEEIRIDILVEAKLAIASLREMLKEIQGNDAKVKAFTEYLTTASNQWGVSFQQAVNVVRTLNDELARLKKGGTVFGNVGGQDLFAKATALTNMVDQLMLINTSTELAVVNMNQLALAIENVALATQSVIDTQLTTGIPMLTGGSVPNSGMGGGTVDATFTDVSNQKLLTSGVEDYTQAVNSASSAQEKYSTVVDGVITSETQLGKTVQDTSKKVEASGNGWDTLVNKIKNTTLGILAARLILGALQAIKQFFSESVKYAEDARAQMIQLNFSEAVLSKRGMDITRAELDGFITEIEKKYKYLSSLEATKIVSETASAVGEFDVSKKQLSDLADSIAFVQLKNKMLGQEEADAAHIINAAMDARSNFFNGMGINITETIIKEKAYKMGLIEVGQELSKQARFQVVLALLTEQTSGKQQELMDALKGTPLGNQMELSKRYSDALSQVGDALLVTKDSVIEFLLALDESGALSQDFIDTLTDLATQLNNLIGYFTTATEAIKTIGGESDTTKAAVETLWEAFSPLSFITQTINYLMATLVGLGTILATITGALYVFFQDIFGLGNGIENAFKDAGKVAGDAWSEGWKLATAWFTGSAEPNTSSPELPDTKTGTPPPPIVPEIDTSLRDKQFDELTKLNDDILAAELGFKQDMENIQIDLGRKLTDITTEYGRKREDAARDYGQKIVDLEKDYAEKIADNAQDYADKIADINQSEQDDIAKEHEDKLKREEDFQRKLKELKEQYMADLEEATIARDAKKIADLTKNYNKEVAKATEAHNAEEKDAQQAAAARKKDYEQQRQEAAAEKARKDAEAAADLVKKKAEAELEYQQKIADLARQADQERADAKLEAQRKQQDLEKALADKYEAMFDNLKNEYDLTDQSLTELVALYQQKYGEILGISQEMLDAMQQSINDAPVPSPSGGSPKMSANTGMGVRTPRTGGGVPKGKGATFSGGDIRAQGEAQKGKTFSGGSMDVAPVTSQQNIIQLSSGVTIEQVRGIISKNNDEIMRAFLDVLR